MPQGPDRRVSARLRPFATDREEGRLEGTSTSDDVRVSNAPRKGFPKSRRGCFNCKRRKIKCQETVPYCENCTRASLPCRYSSHSAYHFDPSPRQSCTLYDTQVFSLDDMRLFHHLLVAAYPHFPVRNDNIWLSYIIPIGHQCEYLMHSMLALAASHLNKLSPSGSAAVARNHRTSALRGLNEALGRPIYTAEEGDAVIAACNALWMQSWYMDDGLQSFLILTRSCELLKGHVNEHISNSILAQEDAEPRLESMRSRLSGAPTFDSDFICSASESVNSLRPFCVCPFEMAIFNSLIRVIQALSHSSVEAYSSHMDITKVLISIDPAELEQLVEPRNTAGQLLLAHMVALLLAMRPIVCLERKHYTVTMYSIRMTNWVESISRNVGERAEMAWPLHVSSLHTAAILERYTLA